MGYGFTRLFSYSLNGLQGFRVDVEVHLSRGMLPLYDTVGLPDAAVKESKQRVGPAIKNSGFYFPNARIVVNLAPASSRKEGSAFDLPIALGILSSSGQFDAEPLADTLILGELALGGEIRRVSGVLPILISAREEGVKKVIIPRGNVNEVSCLPGIEVYSADSLSELIAKIKKGELTPEPYVEWDPMSDDVALSGHDLSLVKGQEGAKRALEIAAAGGHNMLMIGPPGSGKTMLAKCLPTILPRLTMEESLEVTKIYSVSDKLSNADSLAVTRPFRDPHHTASAAALLGGGRMAKPGEVSLAHLGVLFLDEFPEFQTGVLEALRQPLEDGTVTIARANATVTYPARFMLVASMNPCPCGYYGSRVRECTCTRSQIDRYLGRVSGPMLDRIDMQCEMDPVPVSDLMRDAENEEDSATVRKRVEAARELQRERFHGMDGVYFNAQLDARNIKKLSRLTPEASAVLEKAMEKLKLSARAYSRMIKVSRTIADLDQSDDIKTIHAAEAVQYRLADRKYWGDK